MLMRMYEIGDLRRVASRSPSRADKVGFLPESFGDQFAPYFAETIRLPIAP